MNTYKPKRYATKYEDHDQITDIAIGADGTEYVVTMSGKEWRDYDWIIENQEPSARRMADYTHYIYLQHQDECTHSMVLAHAANGFKELRKKRRGSETEYIDPKFGTVGSA